MPKSSSQTDKPAKRKKIALPTTEKPYEIPGLPLSEGPQSSARPLKGAQSQPVVIALSAGAFQYVWEMLEARARLDHKRYSSIESITAAAEESVAMFRLANSSVISRNMKQPAKRRRR